MRALVIGVTMALTLAACGNSEEREVMSGTVTDPETGKDTSYVVTSDRDGGDGTVTVKSDKGTATFGSGAAHARLPAGIAPFPGAMMTGGFAADGPEGTGGMATFTAKAASADVIAHFRRQAEAQGMKVISEVSAEDTRMIAAEAKDGSTLQITATQEGDSVTGNVAYGKER